MRNIKEFYGVENKAPREGKKSCKSEYMAILVEYENNFLIIKWKNDGCRTHLYTGYDRKKEDIFEKAIEVLKNYTGYCGIEMMTTLVNSTNSIRFFDKNNQVNRIAVFQPILIQLNSLQKNKLISVLKNLEFDFEWLSIDEIKELGMVENHMYMLDMFLKHLDEVRKTTEKYERISKYK